MNLTLYSTITNNTELRTMNYSKQTQTNPIPKEVEKKRGMAKLNSKFQAERKTMLKLNRHLGKLSIVTVLAAVMLLGTGCGASKIANSQAEKSSLGRPTGWATPIAKEGLPNFHKVSADLYRGAQPSAEGIRQLKEMGIKTIVNLRSIHSDKDEIGDVKIVYEHIGMEAWWHPEKEDVVKFLKIVTDKEKMPVFVHCHYGSDRTGLMCAIYRVAVCGWSKEAAADEMVNGGFGFHPIWKNLRDYLMKLDVEKVRRKAGIRNQKEGS